MTEPILLGGSGVPLRMGTSTETKPVAKLAATVEPETELRTASPAMPPFSTSSGARSPIPVDAVANIVDGATVRRPVASGTGERASIAAAETHEGPSEAGVRLLQVAACPSRVPRSNVARRLEPRPANTATIATAASVTDVAATFVAGS